MTPSMQYFVSLYMRSLRDSPPHVCRSPESPKVCLACVCSVGRMLAAPRQPAREGWGLWGPHARGHVSSTWRLTPSTERRRSGTCLPFISFRDVMPKALNARYTEISTVTK